MNSYEKYVKAIDDKRTYLCIGLDSDINKMPEGIHKTPEGVLSFNKRLIDSTHDLALSYKINFAFYEILGSAGFEIIKKTIEYIPENVFVIADAKRGDIGNTSRAYADSCFNYFKADSITVNPYMGKDSVSPFLEFTDKIIFLLALTSNPGSNDFQRISTGNKEVYQEVILKSSKWASPEQLGYVVGATHPEELANIRAIVPDNMFLIPGVGTQGGNIQEVLKSNMNKPAQINVSRDIIFAGNDEKFAESARNKAIYYRDLMRTI